MMSFDDVFVKKIIDRWPGFRQWVQFSLSDGIGIYCLSMVFVALIALQFHCWLRPEKMENVALRGILTTQQEPLRPESFPGLSGAILNSTAAWSIHDDKPMLGAFRSAFRVFERRYNYDPADLRSVSEIDSKLVGAGWDPPPLEAVAKLKACDLGGPGKYSGCPIEVPGEGYAEAFTDTRATSTLRIPSGISEYREHPTIRRFIDRSIQIEALVPLLGALPEGEPGVGASFMAFYAISKEGAVRLVARTPKLRVAPHRIFNGANYFFRSMEIGNGSNRPFCTLPYPDLLGNGIVVTTCYPFRNFRRSHNVSAPVVDGVFCADIGVPRETIIRQIVNSRPLFNIDIVRIPADRSSWGEETICSPTVNGYDCQGPQFRGKTGDSPAIRDAVERWRKQVEKNSGNAGEEDFKVVGDELFAASIWRGRSGGHGGEVQDLILLNPRRTPLRQLWPFLGILVCSLFAGGMAAWNKLAQQRLAEAVVVRGLPKAVVRLDENDFVVGANDAAEELLGTPLPRMGVSVDLPPFWFFFLPRALRAKLRRPAGVPKTRRFGTFLNPAHVVVFRNPESGGPNPMSADYSVVALHRMSGVTSEYWALLPNRSGWLHIVGSPLIRPDGSLHTFALLEHERTEGIVRELDEARRRGNEHS